MRCASRRHCEPGELTCTVEIAEEQIHHTLQNFVRLLGDCRQEFVV